MSRKIWMKKRTAKIERCKMFPASDGTFEVCFGKGRSGEGAKIGVECGRVPCHGWGLGSNSGQPRSKLRAAKE
jgi:hypothetical protein